MSIDRRTLWMLGGLVLAVAAYAGGVWWPSQSRMRQLRQDIAQAEKDLGIARDRTDGLSRLVGEVDDLRARVNSTNKIIPVADEMASVLRTLSVYVEDQDLAGQGLSTEPTIVAPNYLTMPVRIQFTGDSLSAFEFVHRLESMPKMVQVEELEMKKQEGTDGDVQATLKLNTYFTATEGRAR